jgi:type II secretory pathway pseudopilin PulG
VRRRAGQAGFTLMDVLAAIVVMTVGITGLLAMQIASINANNRARELMEAAQLCQDKVEQLRLTALPLPLPPGMGYEDVDARGCILGTDPRAWCAGTAPGPRYQRTWIIDAAMQNRFEVRVNWTSSDGTFHTTAVSYVR